LQPSQDDRGIKPARIGEHHFADLFVHSFQPVRWVAALAAGGARVVTNAPPCNT
jgi:hypothetical protein